MTKRKPKDGPRLITKPVWDINQPKNTAEEIVFAEESFRVEVELSIHKLMLEKKMDSHAVGAKLGVDHHHIEWLLDGQTVLTMADVARLFWALGEVPVLKCERKEK